MQKLTVLCGLLNSLIWFSSLHVPLVSAITLPPLANRQIQTDILPTNPTYSIDLTLSSLDPISTPTLSIDIPAIPSPSLSVAIPEITPVPYANETGEFEAFEDIDLIYARRLSSIIGSLPSNKYSSWLKTLGTNGKWPDSEIDYTTGCEARRANWPAQTHWTRIVVLSAAWHGGYAAGREDDVKNATLRSAIDLAMNYWLSRDFNGTACLDSGGTAACPCENPGNWLWNTNWFSNIILIPKLVTQTCLILNGTLSNAQSAKCSQIADRSYAKFHEEILNVGGLTGANALDVARVGLDKALFTRNATLFLDALDHVRTEMVVKDEVRADGIRADGAFGQHDGMLYNGNYGKEFSNGVLDVEIETAGTRYTASESARNAFDVLFGGNKWMIFKNTLTQVLHWDYSALGRFLVFPVSDTQPTRDISMNLTKVAELGELWGSQELSNFADNLTDPATNVNAGGLLGNKMFFTNDLMVHRGQNYVTMLKLWSTRTRDGECTNSANPLGFHLTSGAQYTHIKGDEYEDVPGAWDWNLIPGITTDYGVTPLTCANTRLLAKESFVGGVSDGKGGVGAMRFTNPVTKSMHWQKAWFFLENDVEHVMVANLSSNSVPAYTVLDQRKRTGPILVNNSTVESSNHSSFASLWHGDAGYTFDLPPGAGVLSISTGEKNGNWQNIGTSAAPTFKMNLFSAWIEHKALRTPIAYTIYPGVTQSQFFQRIGNASQPSTSTAIRTIRNDGEVSAIFDAQNEVLMAVFWNNPSSQNSFTSIDYKPSQEEATVTLRVNAACTIMYRLRTGEVTVSDPSQVLHLRQGGFQLKVEVAVGPTGTRPFGFDGNGFGAEKVLVFELPEDGVAGSSVTKVIV